MISLLCPSRQRPQKMFHTITNWLSKARSNEGIEVILSIDSNDPSYYEYLEALDGTNVTIISNPNRSAVDAINNAAKVSTGTILIVVSDDFDCTEAWDKQLIEATRGKSDWIAKTPDGIQKWIITLPIMDRIYYNRFGYIYFPDYLHMFCDTEITCVADLTGRKIELNIPFIHNHYSTGKSVKDEVSVKADLTWNQGESLFIERAKRNFDLVNYPGAIVSQEYKNWLRMKGVSV